MKRLLGWFEGWAGRRLRKSQIKILYQNQHAIEFLLKRQEQFLKMTVAVTDETLEALLMFESYVDHATIQLTYRKTLPDEVSSQLLQINNGLKNIYAGMNEGTRLARAQFGQPSGDIVPFATRFAPAGGWNAISENEWDTIVRKALDRLPNG